MRVNSSTVRTVDAEGADKDSAPQKNPAKVFAGFQFEYENTTVEATVFPVDGIRQAPISPINGKPMRRADVNAVRQLLAD